jgi:hypothetical protein
MFLRKEWAKERLLGDLFFYKSFVAVLFGGKKLSLFLFTSGLL